MFETLLNGHYGIRKNIHCFLSQSTASAFINRKHYWDTTSAGKHLFKKLCYFSHSYWKSFCFTLVDAKSNYKYPYFNWKKFSLLLQRTISLKHARKRLFWVYLWEPARSVHLLPVQLEIRFIYAFSFPVLKIYRISSGTYQRRWRSEYQKENVKQEWKIVTQFKIQDTKCFKSTDLWSCWLISNVHSG